MKLNDLPASAMAPDVQEQARRLEEVAQAHCEVLAELELLLNPGPLRPEEWMEPPARPL